MGTSSVHDNVRVLNEGIENMMTFRPGSGTRTIVQASITEAAGILYHTTASQTSGAVVVDDTQNWEFVAGEIVELLPGFESELHSEFEAYIIPNTCGVADELTCNYNYDADINPRNEYALLECSPNPTSDDFTLKLNVASTPRLTIEVFDVIGRMVLQMERDQTTDGRLHNLSLVDVKPGTYYIRLGSMGLILGYTEIVKL